MLYFQTFRQHVMGSVGACWDGIHLFVEYNPFRSMFFHAQWILMAFPSQRCCWNEQSMNMLTAIEKVTVDDNVYGEY